MSWSKFKEIVYKAMADVRRRRFAPAHTKRVIPQHTFNNAKRV